MGKYNLAVNQILERKEIFADLINGTLYEGKQVLSPEQLELISGQTGILYEESPKKTVPLERRGDIRMKAKLGTYSLILANETQNKVHYAMPVRNMLYDALEYTKQLQELEKQHKKAGELLKGDEFLSGITREDRLIPVITTVLYFGPKWDGCLSLYELMNVDGLDEEAAFLKKYLPDYKINLIHASNIENPEVFHSCLQHIFCMIKYNTDKKQLYAYVKEHRREINQMDSLEMAAAMILLGEQKRLAKILEEKEEEGLDLCTAIDELIEDGRKEEREKGL
ncbi:MAG: hypothetical protein Q4F29_01535, partial [Lachnospiraceae bacterium]|nr:hypothetical protein [Lachnospiraceae bacterium]